MENEINWELVRLGEKAKRVLENEDFKDVVEKIQSDLYRQFRKTNIGNNEDREDLHKLSYALEFLEFKIRNYADDAEFELKTKLDEEED